LIEQNCGPAHRPAPRSPLAGPDTNPEFRRVLDELVTAAKRGQRTDCEVYNPSDQWLKDHMRILQNLSPEEQQQVLNEVDRLRAEAAEANAEGRAATRVWPEVAVRLDNQGLDFFSQLGVVRRPDLTLYYIDGFGRNRDALAFDEENQALFTEVFRKITQRLKECLAAGETVVQTDRQIGDAPGRSFHARQLLFGIRYLQIPYMWRQLTFDLPESDYQKNPDIIELSIPCWMEDLGLSEELKSRVRAAGLTQLIFKAPTRGLSLHLGFDYVGEHKMGPLSIAMFLVKQNNGLAVQAALSMARARTLSGSLNNTAVVTIGPSLHGKSTLTIMIELAGSDLARLLHLPTDPEEGVCPMNDDIVLLQPLNPPIEETRGGHRLRITHGIDGTENNFYAVPFGLTREDDPITYDVLRGTRDEPNLQETLENVPVHVDGFRPNYLENPVRNMRMILSRTGLLKRKGTQDLIGAITGGRLKDSVHVPMTDTDQVFFQAVMRQNTVVPPLRRLTLEQYIRVLMYGEAVQMGAAIGAIGRPYVEYFSDPFIIGLEDENANLMYYVLQQMERGGLPHHYFVFNTGGVGADTNEQAAGASYKKIPRELTLMLQEALLREAVKFQYDATLRSDIAVAIVDPNGKEVMDLRQEWLPINLYGEDEYTRRVLELRQRRYFGRDATDKAGILRYTKVTDALIDLADVPAPANERELAWLMSFYWKVDQAYNTLTELVSNMDQGHRPMPHLLRELSRKFGVSISRGLSLPRESQSALKLLGIN
jgi:ATP-dependent phosphoenolpyruvate carboxykinase